MYYFFDNGFLADGLNVIPDGAVAITDEAYQALLAGQAAGKQIVTGPDGAPMLADPPAPALSDVMADKIAEIRSNGEAVARAVKVPYSQEEAQTWWCQYHEAEGWTENPSYVPVMLNAMVYASNGGWTLAGLSASILANAAEWKQASGNILGQVKAKVNALQALRDQVISGAATISDLQAFDASITLPTVNLEDKF